MSHSENFLRLEPPPGKRGLAGTSEVQLPAGWTCLRDCNIAGRFDHSAQVDYVLLHPETGIALLDIGRADVPDAEAVLRARLRAACFEGIFPGYLPVVHLLVAPDDLPTVKDMLGEAFAALPPLSLPGGDAWISVVRRALAPQDPARGATPLDRSSRARMERQAAKPDVTGQIMDRLAARPIPRRIAPDHATDPAWAAETDGDAEMPVEFPLPAPERRRSRLGTWAVVVLGGIALVPGLAALLTGYPDSADEPAPASRPAVAAAVREPQPVTPLPPAPPARDDRIAAGAPTPTPSAEGASTAPEPPPPASTAVVRVRANLRAGPSTSATILNTLSPGREFEIHGRAPGGWIQVGDAEPIGWMHSSVLTENKP